MKVLIVQKDKHIYNSVCSLMRINKTNLTQVCLKSKRDYTTTFRELNKTNIDSEYLKKIIEDIDENAILNVELSVSLIRENKVIL